MSTPVIRIMEGRLVSELGDGVEVWCNDITYYIIDMIIFKW